MRIAVLSGKGGTGKTFVSVNLAEVIDKGIYVDCDVEEPNGHLFFKPVWLEKEDVIKKLPIVDKDKCIDCRVCTEFCKFNALAHTLNGIMVFDEICHSCGGCSLVCPTNAISEVDKVIGKIQYGKSLKTTIYSGTMFVNEASGVPIIDQLLAAVDDKENVVIDCPPGSACSVMESIKDADYCVLVGEPTLFGKHNLAMVQELIELYNKAYGVVLNKCNEDYNPTKEYCLKENMNILSEIEYSNYLGEALSNGRIPVREKERYKKQFLTILNNIYIQLANNKFQEVGYETSTHT